MLCSLQRGEREPRPSAPQQNCLGAPLECPAALGWRVEVGRGHQPANSCRFRRALRVQPRGFCRSLGGDAARAHAAQRSQRRGAVPGNPGASTTNSPKGESALGGLAAHAVLQGTARGSRHRFPRTPLKQGAPWLPGFSPRHLREPRRAPLQLRGAELSWWPPSPAGFPRPAGAPQMLGVPF